MKQMNCSDVECYGLDRAKQDILPLCSEFCLFVYQLVRTKQRDQPSWNMVEK